MKKVPQQGKTILLWNETPDHSKRLLEHLAWADRFVCVVAFAKMTGFSLFAARLKKRLAKGMRATFVVGIDFYQTQPELLTELMKMKDIGDVELYMGSTDRQATFHPKLYLFQNQSETRAIVGSANMTMGGLQGNHEMSAEWDAPNTDLAKQVDKWIASLVEDGEIVIADGLKIEDYSSRYRIYTTHMKVAERRAKSAIEQPAGNVETLFVILERMKRDRTKDGFDASVKQRAKGYRRGAGLLTQITRSTQLTPTRFQPLYEGLISEAWHSGGLHRGKNIIIDQAKEFQAALQSLQHVQPRDAASLFEHLRTEFKTVERVGTNVITEILHSLDNGNFAVMNKNSVSGMRLAKIAGFPEAPNKSNLNGTQYALFCVQAAKVRNDLGLNNFSELDAVFNYAYWK